MLLFLIIRPDLAQTADDGPNRTPPSRHQAISALDSQIDETHIDSETRTEADKGAPNITGTWGALRNRPPIDLPGGGTARVGLEANSAPVASGIMIYCLVDGEDQDAQRTVTGKSVGPLSLKVHRPDPQEARELMAMEAVASQYEDGERLFVQSIPIATAGEYRVELSLQGEEVFESEIVAEFTLTGTGETYHSWLPFRSSADQPLQEAEPQQPHIEGAPLKQALAFSGGEPAIPTFDGLTPLAYSRTGTPSALDDTSPLPGLIPAEIDPRLVLQATEGGFSLDFESPIFLEDAGENLLARWWVNGVPHAPNTATEAMEQEIILHEHSGPIIESRRLEVSLDLDLRSIGARPGDRIGLQILQVDQGWQPVRNEGLVHEMVRLLDQADPPLPRLSNRIEFRAR